MVGRNFDSQPYFVILVTSYYSAEFSTNQNFSMFLVPFSPVMVRFPTFIFDLFLDLLLSAPKAY